MFVHLDTAAINALLDVARDEIKAIESGETSYGGSADNLEMIEALTSATDALAAAIDGGGW